MPLDRFRPIVPRIERLAPELARELPLPGDVWHYDVAGHAVQVAVPDPGVIDVAGATHYWGLIWEPALLLAAAACQALHPERPRAIELGCGLGLPGLAVALAGARVTFLDRVAEALAFVRVSLALNRLTDCALIQGDWTAALAEPRFDLILGSEVLYATEELPRLIRFLPAALAPGGRVHLIAEDRPATETFVNLLAGSPLVLLARHQIALPAHPESTASYLVLALAEA